ncbi:MAG TPA: hypothetical protein VD908_02790 [Cytophagales bacterium]|nr:hypothetical protein [Cytophagales bacterium]
MNPVKAGGAKSLACLISESIYNQQWDDRLLRNKITANNQSNGLAGVQESKIQQRECGH